MAGEIEQATERTLTHVIGHDADGLLGRQAVSAAFRVVALTDAQITAPSDTNENILSTVQIPAGSMGANGLIRVEYAFAMSNNANVKTSRLRLGGIGGTVFGLESLASNQSLRAGRFIKNVNSESAQIGSAQGGTGGWVLSTAGATAGTIDTTVDQNLVLTVEKATAGDVVRLDYFLVELFYKL